MGDKFTAVLAFFRKSAPPRHVCQHCDWFVVPSEDAICRGCVIDQFGIDPGDNYNLFQDLNPGNHGP